MKWHPVLLLLILLFIPWLRQPLLTFAAPSSPLGKEPILTTIWKDIDCRLGNLNYAKSQQPAESDLNRNNHLKLCAQTLTSALRPDCLATFPQLQLSCKPRLEIRYEHWDDGPDRGHSTTDADLFVHEYAVRLPVGESVLLSYGREDLQWGPAFLLSPSNPFFSYNGRNQPKIEVRSAEYGRLIWSPNLNWSASFIINTGQGRKKLLTNFRKSYAAKLDYLAEKAYFSLIASCQEATESTRLGGFLSWNVSDSTIIYTEGSVTDEELEMLTGCSYTFDGGSTVSGEYFYNGNGRRHGSLIKKLTTLDEQEARESLFRRHYLLLQYYDSDQLSRWNILFRNTINLDDKSFSLLAHGEYNTGDHSQLFATATINDGDRHSELAAVIDSSFMIGVEITY